jgi:hypothetical protein
MAGETTQKVEVYNKAINTLEVAGEFWIGRQKTTRELTAAQKKKVEAHRMFEVVKPAKPEKSEKSEKSEKTANTDEPPETKADD